MRPPRIPLLSSHLDIEPQLPVVDPTVHHPESSLHALRDLRQLGLRILAHGAFHGLVAGPDLDTHVPEIVGTALAGGSLDVAGLLDGQDDPGDPNAVVQRVQQVRKLLPSRCNLSAAR